MDDPKENSAERLGGLFQQRQPSCWKCKHWKRGTHTCAAFPDKIPSEIASGFVKHFAPYDGDNGIQFEPIDE